MTKLEKIIEVYGPYYEDFKDDITEEGVLVTNMPLPNVMRQELQMVGINFTSYIPKQLVGISDNNGWTIISSIEDLPIKLGLYRWINRETGKQTVQHYNPKFPDYKVKKFSHYRPLEIPDDPIY
jgi:hypothetical protein